MNARKRTSLEAVFGAKEQPTASVSERRGEGAQMESPNSGAAEGSDPQERAGGAKRPNVKQHTAYLPIPVHEQLRRLAFEENRKIHDYLVEGLDRVFADRGLPAIKDIS